MSDFNYEIFEFEDYDSMDEFKISNLYEDRILFRWDHDIYNDEISVKVWKKGLITDLNDKVLKTKIIDNIITWEYNKAIYSWSKKKHSKTIDLHELIWDVYKMHYPLKSKIIKGNNVARKHNKDSEFHFIDGNNLNISLQNVKLSKKTIEGTKIFSNPHNYFELDLEIPNDDDEFLNLEEPVILEEYPDLEIYKNGQILDSRNKSRVRVNKEGYQVISYKGKTLLIHRLVGLSYLKNKYSYNFINHIDGDRTNNNLLNLEWINNSLNTLHGELRQPKQSYLNCMRHKTSWDNSIKVCLTSKNYKEFIRKKVHQELDLEPKYWFFSNSEPFFLFYIPYRKSLDGFKYPNLLNPKLNIFHKINNGILKGLSDEGKREIIIDLTNRFYNPKSKSDHIINLLKLLEIDYDIYLDWLFDDLKKLVNDDVGFIYFREFHRYYQIIRMSDDVIYELNIEHNMHDKNRKRRPFTNTKTFQKENKWLINITVDDRVVETLDHHKISASDEKKYLNLYFYESFYTGYGDEMDFNHLNQFFYTNSWHP